jgi:glc operon protein GlcG
MPHTRLVPVLTLEAAKRLAAAAEAEAVSRGWTVAIAVVNPEGGLILFHSLDGTQPGSQDIAVLKARTAARLRRSTQVLEDGIAGGRIALATLPGVLALGGGVPVAVDGQLVGALGVSGMTSPEDNVIAAAALQAFGQSS